MKYTSVGRKKFLDVLVEIAQGHRNTSELTKTLRQAIKQFGSETPDNIDCASAIEVGRVDSEKGLKFNDRPLLFSEVAHALEGLPMPASVKNALPGVSDREWEAYLRLTTLIYTLLRQDVSNDIASNRR